jgi:hypothetical protein
VQKMHGLPVCVCVMCTCAGVASMLISRVHALLAFHPAWKALQLRCRILQFEQCDMSRRAH